MRPVASPFTSASFVGGHAVLDFVNTAAGRQVDPRDWLGSYARLLDWAGAGGFAATEALAAAARLCAAEPAEAEAALGRAKALREALYGVLTARVHGNAPEQADLTQITAAWAEAARCARLTADGGLHPLWLPETAGLDWLRFRLADAAMEFLRHVDWQRLRQCDGDNCDWLFLDTSKSGRRRWCDMATCGNVAKARRHYHRTRHGA